MASVGYKLLVRGALQLVQVNDDPSQLGKCGQSMSDLTVLQGHSSGYALLVNKDGRIADLGDTNAVESRLSGCSVDTVIDATGKCLFPGLVDAHTHSVWAGDRVHEFSMKLVGASYMDIHNAGGGIHFTVEHTRQESEQSLYLLLEERLRRMLHAGTTLVEIKTGYGLDLQTEVKMLQVIERARRSFPMDISSTYCGAHAVPRGVSAAEATADIIGNQIPHINNLMASGQLCVNNIDVFCEKGVFDVIQSRDILLAGQAIGLNVNFHAEELHQLHSAEMAAEIGALAVSHLEEISNDGIAALARSGTVGVLLPTTAFALHLKPPPARAMIQSGMCIALGSDFNPNVHCLAMPLVMSLACIYFGLSPEEAVTAATLNSARALGESNNHGSLTIGKWGNMLLVNNARWEHIIYQMGCHNELISHVIWHGDIVHQK